MAQGEAARGGQGPNAFRAASPCVTDDRTGDRRVPPTAPVAPPFKRLDRLLRLLADGEADSLRAFDAHPRLMLVREPDVAPIGGAIPEPRVVDLYERHVAGAVQALEPAERACIELSYFEGLGVHEIAGRCEMSPDAVDDRLRRGLNDMLRYLRACATREAATRAPGVP